MKYAAVSIVLVVVLGVILFFTVEKRQVGERDVCEACSKVLRENVREKFVPVWDKSKVTINHIFCNQCGNEQVTTTRAQQCRNCGKLYDVNKETALRKDRKQDMITKTGFCSDACSNDTVTVRAQEDWVYHLEKGDRLPAPGVFIENRLMFDWICVMTRKKLGIKPLPNDPNIWEEVRGANGHRGRRVRIVR